jgi:hypothetical protein
MGHEAQGNHDAIVTTSLFSLVGEILDTHGHRLGRDHVEPTSLGLESITQSQGHPNQEATTAKEMSNPYRT